MKLAIMLLAGQLLAQAAGVQGTVFEAGTGKPLADVHVRLLLLDSSRGTPVAPYGAMSKEDGSFAITGMPAGRYLVQPDRREFIRVPGNPPASLSLTAEEQRSGLKIEMARLAVLSGRVVDGNGDPVGRARVRAVPADGRPVMPEKIASERGEYRLALTPGRYYVQVAPPYEFPTVIGRVRGREIRGDGTAETTYATTYFPSVTLQERAVILDAVAGRETSGVDVRLAPEVLVSISGTVVGQPANTRCFVTADSGIVPFGRKTTGVDLETGTFIFPGLTPGTYRVKAATTSGELQSLVEEVRLGATNVENLQLTVRGGEELNGTLEVKPARGQPLRVRLEPAEIGASPSGTAGPGEDGRFRIPGVLPGRYKAVIEPLPQNAYVESLQLDGAAVRDNVINLDRGPRNRTLRVVVNLAGAQITGSVRDAGPGVTVVLARTAREIQSVRTGADGRFEIHAIPAGKYRLFVAETLPEREALEAAFEAAPEIEIGEGEWIRRDL